MSQVKDSYRISHLEYLGDILGSTTTFAIAQTLAINPGMPSFPWLSPIASAYEMYRFTSLKFIYAGRSSSAVGGYCTLAIDYDPTDPPPASKTEINNFNDRVAVVPWEPKATLVCSRSALARMPKYMTRSSSIADELANYDVGTFYVVAGNQLTNAQIGELWVEYSIEFFQPQTNRAGNQIARSNALFNFLTNTAYPGGVFTVPFSNTVYNPFGFVNTAGVLSGIAGVFTVYAQIQYTAATAPTIVQMNIFKNGASVQNLNLPGATSGTLNLQYIVSLAASDTISITFVATGGTTVVLTTGAPAGSANVLQLSPA